MFIQHGCIELGKLLLQTPRILFFLPLIPQLLAFGSIKEDTSVQIYEGFNGVQTCFNHYLLKLKKALCWSGTVTIEHTNFERCDRCRLYFNDKQIWHALNNKGCTPRKSLTLVFPNKAIEAPKIGCLKKNQREL